MKSLSIIDYLNKLVESPEISIIYSTLKLDTGEQREYVSFRYNSKGYDSIMMKIYIQNDIVYDYYCDIPLGYRKDLTFAYDN